MNKYKTHIWGEKDFDWEGLDAAITDICGYLNRWTNLHPSGKEKWGRADIYVYWTWPYKNLPGLSKLINTYNEFQYRRAYSRALNKWPHLKWEILGGMNYAEDLAPIYKKHRMETPHKSDACWKGNHQFGIDDFCTECYLHISEPHINPEVIKYESMVLHKSTIPQTQETCSAASGCTTCTGGCGGASGTNSGS